MLSYSIRLSIVIPTLNEETELPATLLAAKSPEVMEIIVVDGGSTDKTILIAEEFGATVLCTSPGRGHQQNVGADHASGDVLLFLHADTVLPNGFAKMIFSALSRPNVVCGAFRFGVKDLSLPSTFISFAVNFRSKILQMPYGDQGIFLRRSVFLTEGRFPESAILEDYLLIRRLKKHGRVAIAPQAVKTSTRRWREKGIVRTTFLNQCVITGYHFGISLKTLQRWYQ